MAKEVVATVKLLVSGGQATPAPPVGPALGQHQVNIGEFVKKFNDATRDQMGIPIGILLTIYKDRKFDMLIKGAPVSALLKQAVSVAKGSGVPNRDKVGKVSKQQVREIAEKKMKFLNTTSVEQAMRIVAGTARSMGIDVEI